MVEIGVVKDFWVVFGRPGGGGSYPLFLASVDPRAVNHLCPTGLVGEGFGDELDGVLEFISGGLYEGIAV